MIATLAFMVWIVCVALVVMLVLSGAKDHDDFNLRAVFLVGLLSGLIWYPFVLGRDRVRQQALDAGHAEIVDGRFEWLPVGDVAGGGK